MAKTSRLRSKDIEKAIFRPFSHKETKQTHNSCVYTLLGKHDDLDNEYPILWDLEYEDTKELVSAADRKEAYAKKTVSNGKETLFIKRGTDGKLYNPMSLYNDTQGEKKKMTLDNWRFVRVNKRTFDLYLNFLKTKNQAYLNQAQRELI